MVCAGCMDPFHIYVWSLQTGRLLDVLTGHEGPIACLDFSATSSTLASGSWDGTLKLWDVYKNSCIETMEHGCDVMAVSFRPDGKEICTSATNGNLYIWEVETGQQVGLIHARTTLVYCFFLYTIPLSYLPSFYVHSALAFTYLSCLFLLISTPLHVVSSHFVPLSLYPPLIVPPSHCPPLIFSPLCLVGWTD